MGGSGHTGVASSYTGWSSASRSRSSRWLGRSPPVHTMLSSRDLYIQVYLTCKAHKYFGY